MSVRSGERGRQGRTIAMAAVAFVLGVTTALAAPRATGAQEPAGSVRSLRGIVRDGTGVPIEGVQFSLTGVPVAVARAESGTDGRFALLNIPSTASVLQIRRLGYRPDSLRFDGTGTDLSLMLERIAVSLTPMVVSSRRVYDGPMAGFHQRRESGSGRFFTREDIERRNPNRLSDLLRMIPGLRVSPSRTAINTVRLRGARCAPQYWLDGTPLSTGVELDVDAINPRSLEGIEVYSGPASVPIEFQRDRFGNSSCGTVLLWSRRGDRRPPRAAKTEGSAAQRVASLVDERRVYQAADVDVVARVDSSQLVRPYYPDSLQSAAVGGRVLAEFVVDASGTVQIETFSAVTSTNRLFVESVREALREQRFFPAQRRGFAVAQVIQMPFEFAAEPGTARKR